MDVEAPNDLAIDGEQSALVSHAARGAEESRLAPVVQLPSSSSSASPRSLVWLVVGCVIGGLLALQLTLRERSLGLAARAPALDAKTAERLHEAEVAVAATAAVPASSAAASSAAPFSPPPLPSLCLCSHMYDSGPRLRPSHWTLRPVPRAGNRSASPALSPAEWLQAERASASVASGPPYPATLTGNASSTDPRWLRWRFWDSCGLLLPRSTLLHSPPPVVGPHLLWQLPTCLLHDVWIRSHVPLSDDPNDKTHDADSETAAAAVSPPSSPPPRRHVPPLYSVALQIFNNEDSIDRVLLSLLTHTRGPFELVLLLDSAEDASWPRVDAVLREVLRHCDVDPAHSRWHAPFAKGTWSEEPTYTMPVAWSRRALNSSAALPFVSCLNPWLVHVRVLLQPTPVWETSGNNIQLRAAHPLTRFWISVQDDQPQRTRGWNQLLAAPLRWWPQHLLGVSARCAHERYSLTGTAAPCRQPSHPLDDTWSPDMRCRVYVRDTANRGPLLLDYAAVAALGFFDELSRRFENDDHDLFARAWEQHRHSSDQQRAQRPARAAFIPLEWDQRHFPSARGRRRPERSAHEEAWIAARDHRHKQADIAFGLQRVQDKARAQHWPPHDADYALPSPLHSLCLQWSGPPPSLDSLSVQQSDPWMRAELQPWWQQPSALHTPHTISAASTS